MVGALTRVVGVVGVLGGFGCGGFGRAGADQGVSVSAPVGAAGPGAVVGVEVEVVICDPPHAAAPTSSAATNTNPTERKRVLRTKGVHRGRGRP